VRLSVIVITKDEEAAIARALDSVAWADEIVVVDSGSGDRTVEIARGWGAKVVVTPDWPGFGPQKNRALGLATGDWVLSLDADEWVTPASAEEIKATIGAGSGIGDAAYRLPRRSSFCGRFMHHSGWWPDYVVRLFRRGSARFSDDSVHERVIVNGGLGTLREPIMHETFVDLDDLIEKMNRYSTLTAQQLDQAGKTAGLVEAIGRGLWAFVRTYVFRAGFLDGREGFMLALATAEGTYYRYAKLMQLSRK
jgi:glycosyltransferase involved in cell wall biosynthesis